MKTLGSCTYTYFIVFIKFFKKIYVEYLLEPVHHREATAIQRVLQESIAMFEYMLTNLKLSSASQVSTHLLMNNSTLQEMSV